VLQSTAPNPSLEPWSICNCGETKAVNVLVNEGSSIFNIKYHAVRTKTGESMTPCRNYQETLQNATHEKHD
jgi:cytidine deaminase